MATISLRRDEEGKRGRLHNCRSRRAAVGRHRRQPIVHLALKSRPAYNWIQQKLLPAFYSVSQSEKETVAESTARFQDRSKLNYR